jgi:hypothetical protein
MGEMVGDQTENLAAKSLKRREKRKQKTKMGEMFG